MDVTIGADCIGANLGQAPPRVQLAGYSTGTGDVPWSAEQFAANPGALRICQDPGATDATADILDVENYAATIADVPGWAQRAWASYKAVTRPGQRTPAVYASAAAITPVVNELVGAGITSGVGLVVAHWGVSEQNAEVDVERASGPFPIVGFQFASAAAFDWDVFSTAWLAAVAAHNRQVYVTDGTETIGQIAASRNMKPIPWCLLQQKMRPLDANDLVASAVPSAGHDWWTEG